MGTSPAQRFLGRRCKTLLPTKQQQLNPRYSTKEDARALYKQKLKQQHYYNRRGRTLKPIEQRHSENSYFWTIYMVSWHMQNKGRYEIEVGGTTYRQNHAHIIPTKEQRVSDILPFNLTHEDDDTVRDGSVLQGERWFSTARRDE